MSPRVISPYISKTTEQKQYEIEKFHSVPLGYQWQRTCINNWREKRLAPSYTFLTWKHVIFNKTFQCLKNIKKNYVKSKRMNNCLPNEQNDSSSFKKSISKAKNHFHLSKQVEWNKNQDDLKKLYIIHLKKKSKCQVKIT